MPELTERPMKIALTFRGDKPFGGAERRLLRVFNELGKKHQVIFLARACNQAELDRHLELSSCNVVGISETVCSAAKGKVSGTITSLLELTRIRPDAVVTFDDGPFNRIMIPWMHLLKKCVVLTIANNLYYDEALQGKSNRMLERTLRGADHIDLLYPDQKKHYEALVEGKTSISVTPGTFTDLDTLKPAPKRKQFAFLAARLEDYKNPRMVVEAAILCAPALRERGFAVLVCGKGPEEGLLKRLIEENDVCDIVKMPGYIKPHEVLPYVNVLCATGLINNYPSQTIAEAAACGCAVIMTNVGESWRLMDDSYSMKIDPTASALAEAMRFYMDIGSQEQEELSKGARDYAEKHFSIKESCRYFEKICSEAIKEHSQSSQ